MLKDFIKSNEVAAVYYKTEERYCIRKWNCELVDDQQKTNGNVVKDGYEVNLSKDVLCKIDTI